MNSHNALGFGDFCRRRFGDFCPELVLISNQERGGKTLAIKIQCETINISHIRQGFMKNDSMLFIQY